MKRKIRTWDDYYIPGTTILRNKFTSKAKPFGIVDDKKLDQLEMHETSIRLAQLTVTPLQGSFDYDHFKAIHRYIFQDVYEWAGEERTAPTSFMSKNGYPYYPAGPNLTAAAEAEFAKIKQANFLRDMTRAAFTLELGERWGELNVVHSFREGNTRSQCVFFAQLAHQAGWKLDISQFAEGAALRKDFIDARFHGQATGSNANLVAVLDRALSPIVDRQPEKDATLVTEMLEARRIATLGAGRGMASAVESTQTRYTPPTHRTIIKGMEL